MKLLEEVLWPLETAAQLVKLKCGAAGSCPCHVWDKPPEHAADIKEERGRRKERREEEVGGAGDREERHNRPSPTEALDPVSSELPCYESYEKSPFLLG